MKYWYFVYETNQLLFSTVTGGHSVISSEDEFFPLNEAEQKIRTKKGFSSDRYIGIVSTIQISEKTYKEYLES